MKWRKSLDFILLLIGLIIIIYGFIRLLVSMSENDFRESFISTVIIILGLPFLYMGSRKLVVIHLKVKKFTYQNIKWIKYIYISILIISTLVIFTYYYFFRYLPDILILIYPFILAYGPIILVKKPYKSMYRSVWEHLIGESSYKKYKKFIWILWVICFSIALILIFLLGHVI